MHKPTVKEHLNLYYIFEVDKRQHSLPPEVAAKLWSSILAAVDDEDG